MVSLIYAESNPKLIELYRVGAVFTINLKNKTLAITSSTTYWNYTIIYVWLNGILNSKIYIYSGGTRDKAQTISFQFQQDAHMTGILYIDYNRYIGIFAFGRMSGVANILNSAATVIPSLNSHDNTVSVNLTIWGNCKLITMDRNVKVIGSL